jgi:DDE superfamily endonuclease
MATSVGRQLNSMVGSPTCQPHHSWPSSIARRYIRAPTRLFVIVDNLRVHRAKMVTAWVEENQDRIELFYLPPYAPERNPDEYANNDVKQGVGRRATPMEEAAMKAGLTAHMRSIQGRQNKVRSFFRAPDVRYAA